jgi:predicted amidophosphoribosyltransferase
MTELICPECGSDLLKPIEDSYGEFTLKCASCGREEKSESYIPKAIAETLRGESYIAMTDGGDPPFVSCPECGEDAYVIEEGRCAVCQHEAEHQCRMCGEYIPPWELDSSPLCGYCYYISSKDD